MSKSSLRIAASTSAKYGATISSKERPATQPATRSSVYGEYAMTWTEPIAKS